MGPQGPEQPCKLMCRMIGRADVQYGYNDTDVYLASISLSTYSEDTWGGSSSFRWLMLYLLDSLKPSRKYLVVWLSKAQNNERAQLDRSKTA